MDRIQHLRAWSYARQRIGDPATTPEQALRAVVAVYATHPTAPLALWARTASFSPARYRRLDQGGKAVRMPAMRRTVFLVPRKSAARVFNAARASPTIVDKTLKRQDFSRTAYERAAKKVLAATKEAVTSRNLEEAVGLKGPKLASILRALRYEGRILTLAGESLNMAPHQYVAAEAHVPEGLDAGDASEALSWLAGEYLRAYGPARIKDFAWWAGVTKGAATRAIEAQRTVDIGEGLLLLAKDAGAFERVTPCRGEVALLPKWDAYTMGLAPDGRERFVHPDVYSAVYTPIGVGLPGDGNPIMLVNGEAVATWTFSLKEGPSVHPFDRLSASVRKRVDERLEAVAGLLSG